MRLVAVRSTSPDEGLVALLVQEGGPSILAVPVSAREGLSLSAEAGSVGYWPPLLQRCLEAQGGRLEQVRLSIDDDAVLRADLVLAACQSPGEQAPGRCVPCTPGEALMISNGCGLPVRASDGLLRLRGVDLGRRASRRRWPGGGRTSRQGRPVSGNHTATRGTGVTHVTIDVRCHTLTFPAIFNTPAPYQGKVPLPQVWPEPHLEIET